MKNVLFLIKIVMKKTAQKRKLKTILISFYSLKVLKVGIKIFVFNVNQKMMFQILVGCALIVITSCVHALGMTIGLRSITASNRKKRLANA